MMQLADQPFSCTHCGKAFMKEKTLFAHMCEPKRRAMQQSEKRVQAGFMAFNRWFRLAQGSKKDKTYEDFCKSAYYNAFVKFGSFVNNVMPLYPEKFVDFVIKSGVKLDHWCRDELYETYLYEMLKVEPVEAAVQRTITTMMEWSDSSGAQWYHYFNYANFNRVVHDIRNGKISAWVILNCATGKSMLENFNDEQLELIQPALDIAYWVKHFKSNPADVALVKEICKESGID
jgi:hypothetical protein